MKVDIIYFDKIKGENDPLEINVSGLDSIRFTTTTGKQFDISFADKGTGIRIREITVPTVGSLTVCPEAINTITIK